MPAVNRGAEFCKPCLVSSFVFMTAPEIDFRLSHLLLPRRVRPVTRGFRADMAKLGLNAGIAPITGPVPFAATFAQGRAGTPFAPDGPSLLCAKGCGHVQGKLTA